MKLSEITKQSYNGDPMNLQTLINHPDRMMVGKVEHRTLYRTAVNGAIIYDLDGKVAVQGVEFSIPSIPKGFRIGVLMTDPGARRTGLATLLYHSLLMQLQFALVSDNKMSAEAILLWKSLARTGTVYIVQNNKRVLVVNPDDIDSVVAPGDESFLLAISHLYEMMIPTPFDGILDPRIQFTSKGTEFY